MRDNQILRGKSKSISSSVTSELSPPTTANPEYPNTPEKQDSDLSYQLMKMIDYFKKDINNSLK